MTPTRRHFLGYCGAAGTLAVGARLHAAPQDPVSFEELDRAAGQRVLDVASLTSPIIIESMELLRNGREFLVRVRSKDGAEGLSFANSSRMVDAYPIFLHRVAPFCVGRDARQWEPDLWELYRHNSNYKLQGLAFWICVAAAEIAVLDLLGKLVGKSIGDLLGGVRRHEMAVYRASGNRGNRPEEEVEYLQRLVAETGSKAVKFRLGGRMSNNADSLPGRTEALIPLVRKTFGDDLALYADANSSYDVPHAVRVGRMLEEFNYGMYEEPCPFDHLAETKQVSNALSVPVSGGEQESSHWRFRQMIGHRVVDIVQPDLHYYGGLIRAVRVARMAHAAGLQCIPHLSDSGLGYLDLAHFISCIPNPGPHQEFKGNTRLPVHCDTSSLKCENGVVRIPSGPGYGVTVDLDYIREAQRVTALQQP